MPEASQSDALRPVVVRRWARNAAVVGFFVGLAAGLVALLT